MSSNDKMNTRVTIFDVAEAANTSYATVSRVLNNHDNVNPQTRERVLRAIQKLGYVANRNARSLAGAQTNMIGLLIHGMDRGYISELIISIEDETAEAGYDLVIYSTHRHKHKEAQFVNTLTQGHVDGLLMMPPFDFAAYRDTLRESAIPVVLIDQDGMDDVTTTVNPTNWQGAYDATSYLIQLGHRRIAFITGAMEMGCSVDRLEGHKAALADNALPFDERLSVDGNFREDDGYAATRELLKMVPMPTAIIASNDFSAMGAYHAVRDMGLRVPYDMSLIGFDDIPMASLINPPLTTVQLPIRQMGREAVRMLLTQIKNPEQTQRPVHLATQLVVRESCTAPRPDFDVE
jgi:LacI family transcriptional regulator